MSTRKSAHWSKLDEVLSIMLSFLAMDPLKRQNAYLKNP